MSVDSVLNLATYGSISTDGERFTDPCVAEIDHLGWTKGRSCSLTSGKDVVAGFLRGITLAKFCTRLCHSLQRIWHCFATGQCSTPCCKAHTKLPNNNVKTLPWPGLSPDFNPIEVSVGSP